jgi:hypothetical protein
MNNPKVGPSHVPEAPQMSTLEEVRKAEERMNELVK